MRKRYLSILITLLLIAFPATAGAAPLWDFPGTGSLAPGSGSVAPEPNYDPIAPDAGTQIATSGFDVLRDGFSFDNWGRADDAHRRNMTPSTMQSLYGDGICARIVVGECVLTSPGAALESTANEMSEGGHCFGMAALAGLFHTGGLSKADYFPSGQSVYQAQPTDELDQLISRYWATQLSAPSAPEITSDSVATTVRKLQSAWARGDNFVLSFYSADGSAGHAVTPISLRDLGDGRTGIVVYDNNFPGVEKMFVADPRANTWYYTTATNPSESSMLYVGSPTNQLELTPLQPTTQIHECPVCADSGDDSVLVLIKKAPSASDSSPIEPNLEFTGPGGGPVPGLKEIEFVSTVRHALMVVPAGTPFNIRMGNVQPGPAATFDVTFFGDGWTNEVDEISLLPGAFATVSVSSEQRKLSLQSNVPLEPRLAIAEEQSNWSVEGNALDLSVLPGTTASVEREIDGDFVYALDGSGPDGSALIGVRRRDVVRDHVVSTPRPVTIPVGSAASVAASTWNGTAPLIARVEGNGVSQTYPLQ